MAGVVAVGSEARERRCTWISRQFLAMTPSQHWLGKVEVTEEWNGAKEGASSYR